MLRARYYHPPSPLEFKHLAQLYRGMQPFARGIRRRAFLLLWSLACVLWLSAVPTFAQGIITTVAGNGETGFWGNAEQAISTPLNLRPYTGGVAVDAAGILYIADTGSHRVYMVANGQRLTVAGSDCWVCAPEEQLAGDPRAGFSGDGGQAFNALLNSPTGLGIDTVGNLYIVDTGNQRIRKVSPNGIITTVAGNGVRGFSGDGGPATAASLSLGNVQQLGTAGYPSSVAVDLVGNLYIPDTENGRVRKVNPAGIITTVVAGLRDPYGVAVDAAGNLFVTDSSNDQILKVSQSGTVTTFVGALSSPSGVALDHAGNLYIADSHTHRIRKVEPNGVTTIVAGSGDPIFDPIAGYYFVGGFSGDGGPATSAQLNFPWSVAVDAAGNIYIADSVNNRIRKVTSENSGASPSVVQLSSASFSVSEGGSHFEVKVIRSDSSGAATVDYTTSDALPIDKGCADILGIASSRCDYATAGGTLHFAVGESAKTITIPIIDDTLIEGNETLTISLSSPTGVALGSPSTATITIVDDDTDPNAANPYLNNAFFVRQQYLDFLLREPDSTGYYDWLSVLTGCGPEQGGLGAPAGCDRVHVSSGFFRSPEFGEKGYWVYRFYESALGRRPQFAEFMPEMRRLSGLMTDAEQEARRADFIARFMQLPEFTNIYAGITDASHASQFIAKLEEKARVTLPASAQTDPGQPPQYGRQQLIDKMASGQFTAAQTLRAFIEQKAVWDTYFYRAFVAMQYFGYLRRDPEPTGYDDWVDVLTNGRPGQGIQPGDYRHLIFGFIYSIEYRERFGKQ